MKAIIQNRYGSPNDVLTLQEIDTPAVNDTEVLVQVRAAAVGIGDWLVANGLPYVARPIYGLTKPKHRVAGLEMSGRVAAVGRNVTQFHEGDEVFGWCNGAFAEYVAVSQDALALKPVNQTHEQSAAVPISALAALQALRDAGRIQPGQSVLILGASGGVGTFAVQLAKAFGAQVTAVCSTSKVDLVKSIGADQVIDYTREDVTHMSRRYDLILDLAGNRPLSHLRRALGPTGTLVIVGGSGGPWLMGIGRTAQAQLLSPFVRQRLRAFFSKPQQADLMVLKELIESGKVTPVIDRTYPLSKAPEAIGAVGERHSQGKTVITV
jgi:NADPH:quinone reductase-like Zn-dependent oxidoreductase